MKRIVIIMGLLISLFASFANAEKSTTRADVIRYGNDSVGKGVHRTPPRLPVIDLILDTDTKTIEVTCMDDAEATVILYDSEGNVLDYSEVLNTTFAITPSISSYIVRIESKSWYAIEKLSY